MLTDVFFIHSLLSDLILHLSCNKLSHGKQIDSTPSECSSVESGGMAVRWRDVTKYVCVVKDHVKWCEAKQKSKLCQWGTRHTVYLNKSSLHLQDKKSWRHTIGINTCQQPRLTPFFLHVGLQSHGGGNLSLYLYFLPADVKSDGRTPTSPGCSCWTHCDSGFGGQWG